MLTIIDTLVPIISFKRVTKIETIKMGQLDVKVDYLPRTKRALKSLQDEASKNNVLFQELSTFSQN